MKILKNAPLKNFNFYKIGGAADEILWIEKISNFVEIWKNTKLPKLILGGGSNICFADAGFRGKIFVPKFQNYFFKKNFCTVESGLPLQKLVEISAAAGFVDLCELSGIPGNVGGAIRGNAGAKNEISEFLVAVEFCDERGKIQKIAAENCEFFYRESIFKKKNWAILRGIFQFFKKENPEFLREKIKKIWRDRAKKLPAGFSAGCVFKNPKNFSAGKILDELGAKNDFCGDIKISEKHANFFVNLGSGTQQNLLELMRKWRKIAHEKTGILLEPEIFLCDEFGKKINL